LGLLLGRPNQEYKISLDYKMLHVFLAERVGFELTVQSCSEVSAGFELATQVGGNGAENGVSPSCGELLDTTKKTSF
jgi:hypothetical protein